jgi:hypothetical protein
MPTAGGPNTLGESNLVFAYDTGDVKNSYIGEPTVNITSGTITPYTPYNTLVRNGQNFTLTMVPGSAKYLTLHNGTDYVGQTLSYSGYMYKNGVPFNPLSTSTVPTTYQSSSGMSNQFYNPETGYFKFTLYFNASSVWVFHQPVGAADNDIIQINNLQIEVKNHTTPFTTGTRSATQGLLPLIGNSTLDLTNMSFDSNAQMIFDGTNDGIIISDPQYNKTNGQPLTVEVVMKPGRTGGLYQDIVVNRSNSLYNWMLYQHASDGSLQMHGANQNKSGYIPTVGQNIHVVATITEGQVSTLYVNGTIQQVVTGYTYAGWSPSLLCIGVYGTGRYEPYLGNIDIVKIYNRALTSQEVQQNYRQYKTRFNLS